MFVLFAPQSFFQPCRTVDIRDHRAYIRRLSLFVASGLFFVHFFTHPGKNFPLEKFHKNIHEQAPDEERNGNRGDDQGKHVRVPDGGEHEEDGDGRGEQLRRVLGHFQKAEQRRPFRPLQVDPVTRKRDDGGHGERRPDQAQDDDAERASVRQVIVERVGGIGGITGQKYAT